MEYKFDEYAPLLVVVVLLAMILVAVVAVVVFTQCGSQCEIDKQAEKIELWQALIADCAERGVSRENCEQMAFETVFVEKPGGDTTIVMPPAQPQFGQ